MQEITRRDDGSILSLRVHDSDHVPSWKVFGKGSANIAATIHTDRKRLSIVSTEHSLEGRGSMKQTHFTADAAGTQALFDLLHDAGLRPSGDDQ